VPPTSRVSQEAVRSEIRKRLHSAWVDSKMTLATLLERSGLDLDEPGLSRRLRGKYALTTFEAEKVAGVLDVKIAVGKRRRAA
jgi:hypothetical protein